MLEIKFIAKQKRQWANSNNLDELESAIETRRLPDLSANKFQLEKNGSKWPTSIEHIKKFKYIDNKKMDMIVEHIEHERKRMVQFHWQIRKR